MKRFLISFLSLAALFGVLLVAALLFMPYDKKFGYQLFKGDDLVKTRWVHCRLFESDEPIDVAFVGTSHTYFGINDTLIAEELRGQLGEDIKVANLAFPGRGRNHHLTIIEDLLEQKKPEVIVLEVMEHEARSSHDVSGAIASSGQLASILHPTNLKLVRDVSTYYNTRKRYLQYLLGAEEALIECGEAGARSFAVEDTILTRQQAEKALTHLESVRKPIYLSEDQWDIEFAFPLSILNRIIDRCEEEGVELIFLYNPYYTAPATPAPYFTAFYKEHGTLLTPPKAIFDNHTYWFDGDHLNARGNTLMSAWVAEQLSELL